MDLMKFLPVVTAISRLSKDPSTKVACIAIDDDGLILASGYNGFPRGVSDDPATYADKAKKLQRVVHAEANCVAMAARHGIRLKDSNLIVTALYPCCNCASLIIQAGIKKVYAPPMPQDSTWLESTRVALEMFCEAGVSVVEYEYRECS